ncbi:MAG: HlyD family efflux transporter periplasmic adaptor subunit [Planctomycetaceae bacterium]|nr:HlyD family efflux transporter periplasmic adaptor subunit [Planctomycetaceae bacterium]
MTTAGDPPSQAIAAIQRLAALQQVSQAAITAGSERELQFIMLNQTAALFPFDRATLWNVRAGPRLVGVSGAVKVNRDAEPARAARRLVAGLPTAGDAIAVAGDDIPEALGAETSVLWLPLPVEGKSAWGLLFERLSHPVWNRADIKAMAPIAKVYTGALRLFVRREPWYRRVMVGRNRAVVTGGLIAAVLALLLVRLPLRIVAPCEVVATRPLPVNAPLDGVIKTVLVRPGQGVAESEPLFTYDDDALADEVDVAQKQVELARSNLERIMAIALVDRNARAEARLLNNRLAQEEVRLESALRRAGNATVTAPEAGTVIMGDPAELSGRPVRLGEAILLIANQADNRLRIWLPQDDRIDFTERHDVKVFLNADAGRSRRARLEYVAAHAQQGQDGIYGFMAEAEWLGGTDGVKLGLRGTAVLYGEDVTLVYWLVRKPLAVVRRFLGV